MNKAEIIESLNSNFFLNNYYENFTVIMGAALVLQDIKDTTSDIDISCNETLFNYLLDNGARETNTNSCYKKIVYKNISFYLNWPVKEYLLINDFKVASILSVQNDKITLAREKDFIDVLEISNKSNKVDEKCENFSVYSYPNILRGMIHNGGKKKLVLMVHGYFSSNKIGPHRLYYQIADEISKLGYCVCRIDLSGMGESEGIIKDVKFNNHLADLYIIINKLLNQYSFKNIDLIGHCSGCYLIMNVLKYCNSVIDKVTLISPFIYSEDSIKNLLDEKSYSEVKNVGFTYRKGLYCDSSFIEACDSLFNEELLKKLKNKDHVVFFSENDELCNIKESIKWGENNNIKYMVIKNANHNYLEKNSREELFKKIKNIYN